MIKRGNKALLLFSILFIHHITVVMKREYEVWRESRRGIQNSKSLGYGLEGGKIVE